MLTKVVLKVVQFGTLAVLAFLAACGGAPVDGEGTGDGGSSGNTNNPPEKSSLIYHYSFDEEQGSETSESQGNASNGQLNNASWTSGKNGGGVEIGGSMSRVLLGNLDVDSDEISITAWINPDSFSIHDARIISKTTGTDEDMHVWMLGTYRVGDGYGIRFRLRTNLVDTKSLVASSGPLTTGKWQHVAATYDGTMMRVFIDGNAVGTLDSAIGKVAMDESVEVSIGNNPMGGKSFDGKIDDVRVYSVALSEQQIDDEINDMLEAPTEPGSGEGGSNNGSGNGGSNNGSGGSNNGGGNNQTEDPPPEEIVPIEKTPFTAEYACNSPESRGSAEKHSRRLTGPELINTLTGLFGESLMAQVQVELELIPTEVHGFESENFSPSLTSSHIGAVNTLAGKLSSAAVTDQSFVSRFTSCNALTSSACVEELVENFGSRALRRVLSNAEVQRYVNAFNSDADISADTLIHAILLDAEFNMLVEQGTADGERYRLNAFEVASRISYRTIASMPDDQLWAAAVLGQLSTLSQVRSHVSRLMATDAGKENVRKFFRNWLEIESEADVSVSQAYSDGIDVNALYEAAVNDFDRFVDYIVWDTGGNIGDMFVSPKVFPSTQQLADIVGTGVSSQAVDSTKGHKGLLLRPASLIGGSNNTDIIHRGVMVRRKVLCDLLPTPSLDIINARDETADPSSIDHEFNPNRDVVRNLTSSSVCMTCHALINPLGFAMEDFDSLGRWQTLETVYDSDDQIVTSHNIDSVAYYPLIETGGTNALNGSADLALALSYSSKLKSCFATQLFHYQHLRHVKNDDKCALSEREDLIAGVGEDQMGSVLDALILNIANEDIFWRGN